MPLPSNINPIFLYKNLANSLPSPDPSLFPVNEYTSQLLGISLKRNHVHTSSNSSPSFAFLAKK